MEIRLIASEIRTGNVANGFSECPAFLFCALSLTRGNEVLPPDKTLLAATFRATFRTHFTPATFFLDIYKPRRGPFDQS